MKVKFKKDPRPTGLSRVGFKPSTTILTENFSIGLISCIEYNRWKILFMSPKMPTVEDPAPFKWVSLKREFESELSARAWFKLNVDRLNVDFGIYKNPNV